MNWENGYGPPPMIGPDRDPYQLEQEDNRFLGRIRLIVLGLCILTTLLWILPKLSFLFSYPTAFLRDMALPLSMLWVMYYCFYKGFRLSALFPLLLTAERLLNILETYLQIGSVYGIGLSELGVNLVEVGVCIFILWGGPCRHYSRIMAWRRAQSLDSL